MALKWILGWIVTVRYSIFATQSEILLQACPRQYMNKFIIFFFKNILYLVPGAGAFFPFLPPFFPLPLEVSSSVSALTSLWFSSFWSSDGLLSSSKSTGVLEFLGVAQYAWSLTLNCANLRSSWSFTWVWNSRIYFILFYFIFFFTFQPSIASKSVLNSCLKNSTNF